MMKTVISVLILTIMSTYISILMSMHMFIVMSTVMKKNTTTHTNTIIQDVLHTDVREDAEDADLMNIMSIIITMSMVTTSIHMQHREIR